MLLLETREEHTKNLFLYPLDSKDLYRNLLSMRNLSCVLLYAEPLQVHNLTLLLHRNLQLEETLKYHQLSSCDVEGRQLFGELEWETHVLPFQDHASHVGHHILMSYRNASLETVFPKLLLS